MNAKEARDLYNSFGLEKLKEAIRLATLDGHFKVEVQTDAGEDFYTRHFAVLRTEGYEIVSKEQYSYSRHSTTFMGHKHTISW